MSGSVYCQQQKYFKNEQDDICPREAFTRDLNEEITEWLESGDQLIIGLDANDDMRQGSVASMLRSRRLSQAIMAKHGPNAPPTTNSGSRVIDGIWISSTLQIINGGYLACGEAVPRTDHQCLFIDVDYTKMYGHSLPPMPTF